MSHVYQSNPAFQEPGFPAMSLATCSR